MPGLQDRGIDPRTSFLHTRASYTPYRCVDSLAAHNQGKHATSARRFEDVSRTIALVIITAVLWCYVYNRRTWEAWQTPLEYGLKPADGDTLSVLAYTKSAMDGHFWPLLLKNDPRLGTPFGGNWNDWPLVEQLIFFSTGTAARVIGLFPAVNAAVLFAHILAAVTFYAVCRALKCDWREKRGQSSLSTLARNSRRLPTT